MSVAARPLPAAARAAELWPMAVLLFAGVAAYAHSLRGPFVFDDLTSLVGNPTIRDFSSALFPPRDDTALVGRPLTSLSFAVNYAIGGYDPFNYHVTNLLIHLAAGFTLYGVVRRTLLRVAADAAASARTIATGAALLWLVHPLQTESVTFIIQRTESLLGLVFLLTFYAFIRAAENPAARRWRVLAVVACLAGMAVKEVMAVAPVLLLLYDRTFVAGSFAEAWRQRRKLHLALMSTWLVVAALVLASGGSRGGTSGFGTGASPWHYLLTQCEAIVVYLKLSVWPAPLIVDYGIGLVRHLVEVLPQALLVVALVTAGAAAVGRWPRWGFLAAWFFVILAPSSSVIPLATQPIAEHRMYLPLAAVTTAAAIGVHRLLRARSLAVFAVVGALFIALTLRRNQDYASSLALWADTVQKVPLNARAHENLGQALADAGRWDEAFAHLHQAVQLNPTAAVPHALLGIWSEQHGRPSVAEQHYREALRLHPAYAPARINLGALLRESGRIEEAVTFLAETVRLLPDHPQAYINLGAALIDARRLNEALVPLRRAIELAPEDPRAHGNLATALFLLQRYDEAAERYEAALRLEPKNATMRERLELAREQARRTSAGP